MKINTTLWLITLTLFLAACGGNNGGNEVSEPTRPINEFLIRSSAQVLEPRAIKAAGLLDNLGRDDYPLTLFISGDDNLRAYLKAEGLTEEEFLNSPKLEEFYKSQLVYEEIDIYMVGNGPVGNSLTYKSAAGSDITITKTDEDSGADVNGEINGVPAYLGCYRDIDYKKPTGLLCYADAPIVKDFAW